MDWKAITDDLLLLEKLKKRFRDLGCTHGDALKLATHIYLTNEPIVIDRKMNSDTNINR